MVLGNVCPVRWVHWQLLQILGVPRVRHRASFEGLPVRPSWDWFSKFIINVSKRLVHISTEVLQSFNELVRIPFDKYTLLDWWVLHDVIRWKYHVRGVQIIWPPSSVSLLWQPRASVSPLAFFIAVLAHSFKGGFVILDWISCKKFSSVLGVFEYRWSLGLLFIHWTRLINWPTYQVGFCLNISQTQLGRIDHSHFCHWIL